MVACVDVGRERRALQLDRVDADVEKDLASGVGHQAKRVAGVGDEGDLAVARGVDCALRGLDGSALAHGLACEHGVAHLGEGKRGTGHGRDERRGVGGGGVHLRGDHGLGLAVLRDLGLLRGLRLILVLVDGAGDAERDAEGDGEHDDVLDGLGDAEQDAEDAGDAGAGCREVEDVAAQGTARGADHAGDERLDLGQVHAEDSGLGDAEQAGDAGGNREGLRLLGLGAKRDREAGTTLGDVCCRRDGQPVGHAVLREHGDVDGGVHLVQAGDDGRAVDEADDDVADAQGHLEEEHEQAEDRVLEPDEDRADEEDCDVGGEGDGDERGHEQVEHLGNGLVEALLEEAEDPDADEDGDDVTLVADPVDAVEAGDDVERDHGSLGDGIARAIRVDEVAADEQGAERCAEVGVAAEDRRGAEAEKNLQVREGAGVDELRDAPPDGVLVEHEEAGAAVRDGGAHVAEGAHDAHEHAGGDDGGDDGDEDVGEDLDGALEGVALLGGLLLRLGLADRGDAALADELVVHLVDRAGAVDDLQLAGGLEVALCTEGVLELVLVDLAVVCDHEAQTGGAVGCGDDVVCPSDRLERLPRGFLVVQCHGSLPRLAWYPTAIPRALGATLAPRRWHGM